MSLYRTTLTSVTHNESSDTNIICRITDRPIRNFLLLKPSLFESINFAWIWNMKHFKLNQAQTSRSNNCWRISIEFTDALQKNYICDEHFCLIFPEKQNKKNNNQLQQVKSTLDKARCFHWLYQVRRVFRTANCIAKKHRQRYDVAYALPDKLLSIILLKAVILLSWGDEKRHYKTGSVLL